MKNWKTTLGGILTAAGQCLVTFVPGSVAYYIGKICLIVGPALLGSSALDIKRP